MIARSKKLCSLILSLTLFAHSSLLPALLSGTLVQTPQGPVPIEKLSVGDAVFCIEEGIHKQARITNIASEKVATIFEIKTKDTTIYATGEHLFFDIRYDDWIKAENLTEKNYLADIDANFHKCLGVTPIKKEVTVYDISLKSPHNFFVSESQILTHNIPPLAIGAGIAWGAGGIALEGITLTIGGLALGVAGWLGLRKDRKQNKSDEPKMKVKVDPQNAVQTYAHAKQKRKARKQKKQQSASATNNTSSPGGPKNDEDEEFEFDIPENSANHMFKNEPGHFAHDTPANRQRLLDLVSDKKNYKGTNSFGVKCYEKIVEKGRQLWAYVWENSIRDGGINEIPKEYNPKTGFSSPVRPNVKLKIK